MELKRVVVGFGTKPLTLREVIFHGPHSHNLVGEGIVECQVENHVVGHPS